MKSIIKSALVFALALTVSNGKAVSSVGSFNNVTPNAETGIKSGYPVVKVSVTFGRGETCAGKGVCHISVTVVNMPDKASYNPMARTLTLDVDMAELEANQPGQVDNLNAPKLIVEQEYTLSDDVCKQLGAPAGLVIPIGEYPIRNIGDRRIIVITGPWL